ncbi:MAG: nitrate reductase [Desulfobacula sp.]|jgi:nitrate reductase gamma subunit|uniref:TmcC family electron transfer complex membrane anchor subunit n=1 Tax=Desulfobacula sp. TaxID=2593537 RepID=UPI001DC7B339|nr:nitrate reductase [Desulfobacula sp.]MBT3486714.1 nitrate reductase [Desulfobacula sp.]MBT3805108.1 nitrate reductase [Desulfobacula sp.]MBT4026026.1 nitrate reductase [Desulfobacula sp.]MBT4199783.1 nitrate reductase [Desulfobacula sp.]
MHSFINFIMGPMVWISFLIFFIGVIFRLIGLFKQINAKENFVYTYLSFKYSFRSIFAWLIPFLPVSTRKSPVFYSISYVFHLLLFLIPIFLLSHVALLEESMHWSWVTLSDSTADSLTLIVIFSLIFFFIRRFVVPEVKFLTRLSDFLFILIVALPFVTGFLAYHQFFAYRWMVIVHVLSGELMIILIPFTRFFHMFLAPLTRAYTGSEFGNVRHAKDW